MKKEIRVKGTSGRLRKCKVLPNKERESKYGRRATRFAGREEES